MSFSHSSHPPPSPSQAPPESPSSGMPAVRIRRNTLSSTRRPSQTLVSVAAPPALFPPTRRGSEALPEEDESGAGSFLSPKDNNRPVLSPLNTSNTTPTRAPPRARSRTIQSIFAESPHPGSPAISTPLLQGRPRRTSNASSGIHGRTRASSVSSGNEGVPLDLLIPESPTGEPGGGVMERFCDDAHHDHAGRVHREGEDDEHHAEMGPEHHDSVVNHLDVIDPTVSVVSHFQNISSGILLPGWLMPRPTLSIPDGSPIDELDEASAQQGLITQPDQARITSSPTPMEPPPPGGRRRASTIRSTLGGGRPRAPSAASAHSHGRGSLGARRPSVGRTRGESYVVLEQHSDPLDQHVVDVLTKKQKRKRALIGMWEFLKTPFGICVAFYGFNVVFWGAAIVFFLAKFINFHNKYKQDLWVEITSQIVNALFTITGIGLLPSRIVDAYRMFIIWRLKRVSRRLRLARGEPICEDPDDLPDPLLDPNFVPVLTVKQQDQLRYQQTKFSASQTWYRPHATETHRAFPIRWALWNTLLMLGNSFFQVILCVCMWTLSTYSGGRITLRMGTLYVRPPWTTGCLIPLSFLCGIGAAVVIWQGGQRSKKVQEVEDKLRDALGIVEEGDEDEEGVLDGGVEEKVVEGAPVGRPPRDEEKGSSAGEKSEGSVGVPDGHEKGDGGVELEGKVV
ncbi:hypothetical protein BDY24DRAFT_386389 [Mrakia frigida]|uniref:uncharacterized protein n=1 Tax=Mrakia frigida TaxID=29902 RepID=UPI003FCBFEED